MTRHPRRLTLPLLLLASLAILATASPAAAAVACRSNGTACWGPYSELVDFVFTVHTGELRIVVEPPVIDGIQNAPSPPCTPNGTSIYLPDDGDRGEELILKQLFLSYARDAKVFLRFHQGPSGYCEISYLRALYGQP